MHRLLFVFAVLSLMPLGGSAAAQADGKPAPAELQVALDDFKTALDTRWSYRHANGADFDGAIAELRKKAAAGMSLDEFGLGLHRIVALGIDGHSGVDGYRLPGTRYLPFLLEPAGERSIAFKPDRAAFLADGFPYLTHIDGRDVDDWCRAAGEIVPKGSPQYVRHRCLAHLRHVDYVRALLKLPPRHSVDVVLASSDGSGRRTLTLPLSDVLPAYGTWPGSGSRVEANVGYLRLSTMVKASSVQEIKQWMPRFRGTAGLIIDVRDNNGGDRDALQLIYSYLAAPADPPRVFTAAAYRRHQAHPLDHLAKNHRMYRRGAAEWSTAQERAVAEFVEAFKAEWELPQGQFSEWHYMALTRLDDPDVYHYDKPTVVLMNGKSFSATDIFLAGLKGMRNVTLVGTASAGGSGYTREVPLGGTPLRLRIGSMVSFQADGRLFDGRGVRPDVALEPAPDYYIGGPDNVLNAVMERLRSRR